MVWHRVRPNGMTFWVSDDACMIMQPKTEMVIELCSNQSQPPPQLCINLDRKLCTLNLWDHARKLRISALPWWSHAQVYHCWWLFAENGSITHPQTSIIAQTPNCSRSGVFASLVSLLYNGKLKFKRLRVIIVDHADTFGNVHELQRQAEEGHSQPETLQNDRIINEGAIRWELL